MYKVLKPVFFFFFQINKYYNPRAANVPSARVTNNNYVVDRKSRFLAEHNDRQIKRITMRQTDTGLKRKSLRIASFELNQFGQ